jgi:hypothetical protein
VGRVLIIWQAIGAVAGGQRRYDNQPVDSCVKAGAIALTIIAGPLNYFGVNPRPRAPRRSPAGEYRVHGGMSDDDEGPSCKSRVMSAR